MFWLGMVAIDELAVTWMEGLPEKERPHVLAVVESDLEAMEVWRSMALLVEEVEVEWVYLEAWEEGAAAAVMVEEEDGVVEVEEVVELPWFRCHKTDMSSAVCSTVQVVVHCNTTIVVRRTDGHSERTIEVRSRSSQKDLEL
jgi:hypothetical protein